MQTLHQLSRKLRSLEKRELGLLGCYIVLVLMALYLRYKMMAAVTFDYTHFLLPWYNFLKLHGLHGFHDSFANYNTPYLLLLWLVTHLPIGPLGAVKSISVFFDLVLASTVFLIVRHFKPASKAPYVALLATLYVPTVFLNSSLWGQCDAIYTSFGLLAFYFSLKDRQLTAWTFWGVAFAFKLQAIFFLPFLVFMMLHKAWRWYSPLAAVAAIAVLSCLPLFEGRSLSSVINIYILQAKDPVGGQPALSWYSPTVGQLLPIGNFFYAFFKKALLIIGAAFGVGVISLAFLKPKYLQTQLLMILTISLLAIPYILPGIHERYLYAAEIALLISSFVLTRYVWAAIAMQVVTVITYDSYFTGGSQQPAIPYAVLSIVVLGMISWMIYGFVKTLDLPRSSDKVVAPKVSTHKRQA